LFFILVIKDCKGSAKLEKCPVRSYLNGIEIKRPRANFPVQVSIGTYFTRIVTFPNEIIRANNGTIRAGTGKK